MSSDEFKFPKKINKEFLFNRGDKQFSGQFCGIPHSVPRCSFFLVDLLCYENPNIKNFLEIGTGSGAQTLQYGLYSKIRDGKVLSFYHRRDIMRFNPDIKRLLIETFPIEIIEADVYKEETIKMIEEWLKEMEGNTLIFCDADGQRRLDEFNTFSRMLRKGDFLISTRWDRIKNEADLNGLSFYRFNDFQKYNEELICVTK